ncbi:MAG: hypothetical protein MUE69_23520 [Myxococcota bacterium]|nr:hypothetical protein [Myxococcota bacterium]
MRLSIVLFASFVSATAFAAPPTPSDAASTASANTATNAPDEAADDLAAELAASESVAQVYVQANAQPVTQPAQPQRLVRQASVYAGVPFFLTDRETLRPGIGFHVRGGWELGWIVPEIALGWQLNLLDAPGNTNLQSVWFSVGVRIQFLNYSNVVPFVSAAFRPSWFSIYDPTIDASTDLTFEPAVTAGIGATIELTQNFGLEVGLQATTIIPVVNEVFVDSRGNGATQIFLYPHFGATYFY